MEVWRKAPHLHFCLAIANLEREGEGIWEQAVSFDQDTSSDGEPYGSYNGSR